MVLLLLYIHLLGLELMFSPFFLLRFVMKRLPTKCYNSMKADCEYVLCIGLTSDPAVRLHLQQQGRRWADGADGAVGATGAPGAAGG